MNDKIVLISGAVIGGPTLAFWLKAAAFEVRGYCPRDEDVYVTYGEPGRMLGRFALHDDRTLFLFVFAADVDPLPATLDLPAQKALLRYRLDRKSTRLNSSHL